ncbi:type IV pilus modification PilV family protein [Oceanisphaera sp.]|uniref:type IV pilus modification PilV family protein n=1 Tax=Oceanisphaera sp. TaxID=1929979 RepID=UPI003A94A2E2
MKRQLGFGLIEVMIAFVIVAVTAGSLLQLSKHYLEYSRDGRSREIALRLLESKLDELRHEQFVAGYQAVGLGNEARTVANTSFQLDWVVDQRDWDTEQGKWRSSAASDSQGDKKDLMVTVAWQDDRGEEKSVTLSSAIVPILPIYAGPFGERDPALGAGVGGPRIK